jgi:peptide/nickel transport system ATP-binding protein
MYLGNVMELGSTEEIFGDPANPYTISLLSAIPTPDPTAKIDRITLRGTPPSPRSPPSGCPFSTRCPMKIRPEAHRDLGVEQWGAIEEFRDVLRGRSRADRSIRERLRERMGFQTRFSDIGEIRDDVFGDVDLPDEVEAHVDNASSMVADGDEPAAREYLAEQFDSVCDGEYPPRYAVGDAGRGSRCHRHDETYESPDSYLESKLGGETPSLASGRLAPEISWGEEPRE